VRAVAWLVVGAATFVSGGFGIPIGFALGLAGWEVYVAACVGSIAGLLVFLFVGDRVRARIVGDRPSEPDPDSLIARITTRFGVRGLGLVGPIVPGVTLSVLIGLTLRFERGAIARWMSIGIAVMYAAYTVGLWLLVEVVGLQ
jgi:hypothetical protein